MFVLFLVDNLAINRNSGIGPKLDCTRGHVPCPAGPGSYRIIYSTCWFDLLCQLYTIFAALNVHLILPSIIEEFLEDLLFSFQLFFGNCPRRQTRLQLAP